MQVEYIMMLDNNTFIVVALSVTAGFTAAWALGWLFASLIAFILRQRRVDHEDLVRQELLRVLRQSTKEPKND